MSWRDGFSRCVVVDSGAQRGEGECLNFLDIVIGIVLCFFFFLVNVCVQPNPLSIRPDFHRTGQA